jgi:hypothetical protein
MARFFYYIILCILLSHYFTSAQTVSKILISGWGGQHDIDVQTAFHLGYESYDGTPFPGEVLIYSNSLQNSFTYAEQNGYEMIIRSTTGLMTGLIIAPPVIITGAGIDTNVTGYKVEFFSEDPITENNLSSFSNGFVAGQLAFISNTLACSIDSSKCLARDTGSEGGEFDLFSGFGKIITENILSPFPVELSSFAANVIGNDVVLEWRTETEIDNYGFEMERTTPLPPPLQGGDGEAGGGWVTIGFVKGYGNSNSPKEYSFIDKFLESGKPISYRLKQIDNNGDYEYSPVITAEIEAPSSFHLSQNYPNPFNPGTSIDFALQRREVVLLKVYNLLGELIQVLINREMPAGIHSVIFDAANIPSGVYVYRFETGSYTASKQMILLK